MTREDWLTEALTRFLGRRSVPMALDGDAKAQARADEVKALLRSVLRHAPGSFYEDWWERAESHIAENSRGRSWPTEADIAEAARIIRDTRPESSEPRSRRSTDWTPDPYAINARRIREGDPVGQEWLFGRNADELLRRGLVAYDDLDRYRRSLRQHEAEALGQERAAELEQERISGQYKLATPVDGRGAGTFGQMGKAEPQEPQRPWYQDTESPAYRQRMRELGRARPQEADWVPDYEANGGLG